MFVVKMMHSSSMTDKAKEEVRLKRCCCCYSAMLQLQSWLLPGRVQTSLGVIGCIHEYTFCNLLGQAGRVKRTSFCSGCSACQAWASGDAADMPRPPSAAIKTWPWCKIQALSAGAGSQ